MDLCTLYLPACQVRVTLGDSSLCCCIYAMYFPCLLIHLFLAFERTINNKGSSVKTRETLWLISIIGGKCHKCL